MEQGAVHRLSWVAVAALLTACVAAGPTQTAGTDGERRSRSGLGAGQRAKAPAPKASAAAGSPTSPTPSVDPATPGASAGPSTSPAPGATPASLAPINLASAAPLATVPDAPAPSATPTPEALPSAVPSFDPELLSAGNRDLLSRIEDRLLSITRVSFSQAQSGLISDAAAGVVSNNTAGIITNNGGTLVGNNGSAYRLQQLAAVPIALEPSGVEVLFQRRHWPDGTKTVQYRDGRTNNADVLVRRLQLDAAGVALEEFKQVQLRAASATEGSSAEKSKTAYFSNGAFSHTYTYIDDKRLDGELSLRFLADRALFVDAAGKTRVRLPVYEVDTTARTGRFEYVFDHLGLKEAGTLTDVKLNADRKIVLNMSDPMGVYNGTSEVRGVEDGLLRFGKTQTGQGTQTRRIYDLQDGVTIDLLLVGGGRYTGQLKEGGTAVANATLLILANGTSLFDLRFLEAPNTPYRLGFGESISGGGAPLPTATAAPQVTTVAGADTPGFVEGAGPVARFDDLRGIAAVRGVAGRFYLSDAGNHRIRVLAYDEATRAWATSTFVGDGTAGWQDGALGAARFNRPGGLAVDGQGNLYVADTENHRIRKVTPAGEVTTLAGDGTAGWQNGAGGQARFNKPAGLLVDGSGVVYVADTENHCVRRVAADGTVTTVAGDRTPGFRDGPIASAQFKGPTGLAASGSGGLIVADEQNHRLRVILSDGRVETFAGNGDGTKLWQDGPALEGGLSRPYALTGDGAGGVIVGAGTLRRVLDGQIGSLAGTFLTSGATGDGAFKDATFAGIRGVLAFKDRGAIVIDRHEVRIVRWP